MKRILSLILVFIILVFSCLPVFADSVVDESYFNFDNLGVYKITSSSFSSTVYNYIGYYINVSNSKIYLFPTLSKPDGKFEPAFLWVGTTTEISLEDLGISAGSSYINYTQVNLLPTDSSITSINSLLGYYRSSLSKWYYSEKSRDFPNSGFYVDLLSFSTDNFLVFDNGKCVSKSFCSSDHLFVEDGDYEEGNIKIEGLTGFFNNILKKFSEQIETLKNIPSTIIDGILNGLKGLFVPDIEQMESIFIEFIDYLKNSFGMNELIETLSSLLKNSDSGSSVVAADVMESVSYSLSDDYNPITLRFSVPFSSFYTNTVKENVGGFLKGIFFVLLIFYNLSEIYFLIRGTRPWKDPVVVSEMNLMQTEKAMRHRARRGL